MALEKIRKSAVAFGLAAALSLGIAGTAEAKQKKHFFECNSINKYDNDIFGDSRTYQDYVGITNVFKLSERLILVDWDPYSKEGDNEECKIYGPKGDVVEEIYHPVPFNGAPVEIGVRYEGAYEMAQFLYNKEGYGKYKAVWYLNDNKAGEDDFTITP